MAIDIWNYLINAIWFTGVVLFVLMIMILVSFTIELCFWGKK